MKMSIILCLSLPALATGTPPTDLDLTKKVDRSLKKTPELKSSSPTYALTVIGKDVSRQSWIIFDLEKAPDHKLSGCVYVDLNGDRDLTQANEKLSFPKGKSSFYKTSDAEFLDLDGKPNGYSIQIVAANYRGEEAPIHYRIFVKTPKKDRFGAWGDQNSDLLPADSREAAPVLHFDGPLQMGFEVPFPLSRSKKDGPWELNAGVGTYGVGNGSFVYQFYRTIPKDVHPTASIAWPAKKEGDPPLVSKFVLKDRC